MAQTPIVSRSLDVFNAGRKSRNMYKYQEKIQVKQLILMIAVSFMLSCSSSSDDDIATINGDGINKQKFETYLIFKRIKVRDDKHRAALLDQFLEAEALSRVISQQKMFNKEMADAELDEFRRQMNIGRYFEAYLNNAVGDEEIKNYYVANMEKYSQQKTHVSHILIRLKKGMTEKDRRAKLTLANEAYSKLKAGEEFKKIADDYSEDRISAKKSGDLGWLKKGAIGPKFSNKIFSMKKSELSEPFETSFGFHIVKIIDEPKTVKKPYKAVKGDIRYQLRQRAKQAELDSLKEKIKIIKKN